MNTLSWLLYGMDAGYNLVMMFTIITVLTAIIWIVVSFAKSEENNSWSPAPYKYLKAVVAAVFIIALVPSKETVYMIIASEAGEMVVNTPEAQEVLIDLKEILEIQLEKLKQP